MATTFNFKDTAIYSKTEAVVGAWLDKPLYRIVIEKDVVIQSQKTYQHEIKLTNTNDIKEIVWYSGYCDIDQDKNLIFPNFGMLNANETYLKVIDNNIYLIIKGWYIANLCIFVEYTKIGDSDFTVPEIEAGEGTGSGITGATATAVSVASTDPANASVKLSNGLLSFDFEIPKGEQGKDGKNGEKGDKGDSFTFEDFSQEQLEGLKGEKGDKGDPGEDAVAALVPRGDYNNGIVPSYTVNDYITYNGNSYACKKDNPNNIAPTTGLEDDEYWQIIALKGAKGEKGDKGDKGDKGEDGRQGIDGLPGKDGTTPTIDPETKHWIIGETDTGVVAEGKDGRDGDDANIDPETLGKWVTHVNELPEDITELVEDLPENALVTVGDEVNGTSSSSKGFVDYSIEEKVVGKWIDNRPVYQKTLMLETSPASGDVVHTDTDIDILIYYQGAIYYSNVWYPISLANATASSSTSHYFYFAFNATTKSIFTTYKDYKYTKAFLTIQYVKISDLSEEEQFTIKAKQVIPVSYTVE